MIVKNPILDYKTITILLNSGSIDIYFKVLGIYYFGKQKIFYCMFKILIVDC